MNNTTAQRSITLAEVRARKPEILRIAARRGVKNIRVFGSVSRGDTTPVSDVDFLVEMEARHGLFDLSGFRLDMEDLLGCRVDVATPGAIDARMKERIYADAKPL
jgi:uncharacterized protein